MTIHSDLLQLKQLHSMEILIYFIFKMIKWPVNMTGKMKGWPVNFQIGSDIVLWLAVISSPELGSEA